MSAFQERTDAVQQRAAYSITSSAMAKSLGGISRRIALAVSLGDVGCVAHKATSQNKLPLEVHRRNFGSRGERDKLITVTIEEGIDGDEQAARAQLHQGCKDSIEIAFAAGVHNMHLLP